MNDKKKIDWQKILPDLQKGIEKKEKKLFLDEEIELEKQDLLKLDSLKKHISKVLLWTKQQNDRKIESNLYSPNKKFKEIVLKIELLPYQFATRSNDIHENGKPWRHDGSQVKFKLKMPHDKLEIFSPFGEFIQSFSVSSNGEVTIKGLKADVYYLYLRGRRITDMEFGEKK